MKRFANYFAGTLLALLSLSACIGADHSEGEGSESASSSNTERVYGSGYSFGAPAGWKNLQETGDFDDTDVFWGDCRNQGCVPNVNVIAMTFDEGLKADHVDTDGLAALQRDTADLLEDAGIASEPQGFEELDGVPAAVTFTGDEMAHGQAAAILLVPNNDTQMYYTVTIRGSYWSDRESSLRQIVDSWAWD